MNQMALGHVLKIQQLWGKVMLQNKIKFLLLCSRNNL